jgi:hypothetical protein
MMLTLAFSLRLHLKIMAKMIIALMPMTGKADLQLSMD